MRDDWNSYSAFEVQNLFTHTLPSVTSDQMDTYNQLIRNNFLDELEVNGRTIAFRIAPVLDKVACKTFVVTANLDGKELFIGCDVDVFTALFPETFDAAAGDVTLLRFLLHLMTQTVGGPVAGLCGDSMKLDLSEMAVLPPSLTMQIDMVCDGQPSATVLVWGALELLIPFAKAAPTVPQAQLSARLNLPFRLASRTFSGPPNCDALLESGGLIYIEAADLDMLFELRSDDTLLAYVASRDGKAVVTASHPDDLKKPSTGDQPAMPKDENMHATHGIVTTLSLEVGAWKLPLAEVDDLSPGTVLNMEKLDLNDVKIRLNGDIVATGSLVAIADGVAVHIKALI